MLPQYSMTMRITLLFWEAFLGLYCPPGGACCSSRTSFPPHAEKSLFQALSSRIWGIIGSTSIQRLGPQPASFVEGHSLRCGDWWPETPVPHHFLGVCPKRVVRSASTQDLGHHWIHQYPNKGTTTCAFVEGSSLMSDGKGCAAPAVQGLQKKRLFQSLLPKIWGITGGCPY